MITQTKHKNNTCERFPSPGTASFLLQRQAFAYKDIFCFLIYFFFKIDQLSFNLNCEYRLSADWLTKKNVTEVDNEASELIDPCLELIFTINNKNFYFSCNNYYILDILGEQCWSWLRIFVIWLHYLVVFRQDWSEMLRVTTV